MLVFSHTYAYNVNRHRIMIISHIASTYTIVLIVLVKTNKFFSLKFHKAILIFLI